MSLPFGHSGAIFCQEQTTRKPDFARTCPALQAYAHPYRRSPAMSDLACASPHALTRPVLGGWLAALATVTIWALWAVATRHAVTHDLPPAAIGLLRFGVPALLLAPMAWRVGLFPKDLGLLKGLRDRKSVV